MGHCDSEAATMSSGCSDGISKNTPGLLLTGHQPNPRECQADKRVQPPLSSPLPTATPFAQAHRIPPG